MPGQGQSSDDLQTRQQARFSQGHNPPRYVDEKVRTYEAGFHAVGGPGRGGAGQGTTPWVAGSLTIGTGQVLMVDLIDLETSSANVWWLLRHNHPGTSPNTQGGTIDSWHQSSEGGLTVIGDDSVPVTAIREPGTLELVAYGARNALTGEDPYEALGTNPNEAFSGRLRGYYEQ